MEIKDIIHKRREELNLTYEQLGNMIGVGKSTVRKWETGMIENMRRDNIVALAKALNISPGILMGWDVNEEKIVETINPIFKAYKENEELFNSLSSHSEESFKNFDKYLYSTFEAEIKEIGDKFTTMDTLTLYEYVNKIISFELNKVAKSKNKISNLKDNVTELIPAINQKFEDKPHLMPIASHDKEGNFTTEEYKHDDDIMNDDDFWNK